MVLIVECRMHSVPFLKNRRFTMTTTIEDMFVQAIVEDMFVQAITEISSTSIEELYRIKHEQKHHFNPIPKTMISLAWQVIGVEVCSIILDREGIDESNLPYDSKHHTAVILSSIIRDKVIIPLDNINTLGMRFVNLVIGQEEEEAEKVKERIKLTIREEVIGALNAINEGMAEVVEFKKESQ